MRFLTLAETLELHRRILEQSGGLSGIRDLGALQSALAQPRMMFGGEDLYPTSSKKLLLSASRSSKIILSLMAISASDMRRWKCISS